MKRLATILVFIFAICAFAAPKVKAPPFAKDGEILLEPTYCCCSVEFGAAQPIEGLALEYRKTGGGRGATALPGKWRRVSAREWHHFAHVPRLHP